MVYEPYVAVAGQVPQRRDAQLRVCIFITLKLKGRAAVKDLICEFLEEGPPASEAARRREPG